MAGISREFWVYACDHMLMRYLWRPHEPVAGGYHPAETLNVSPARTAHNPGRITILIWLMSNYGSGSEYMSPLNRKRPGPLPCWIGPNRRNPANKRSGFVRSVYNFLKKLKKIAGSRVKPARIVNLLIYKRFMAGSYMHKP